MAYIKLCSYEEMDPEIQVKAKEILKKTGKLGEIFELIALNKDIYNATDNMVQSYLLKETLLPYSTKERIALLISIDNGCKMCVDVHKNIAKMLGMSEAQILEAVTVTGYFNYINTLSNVFGLGK